jgi:hypothetical protein
VTTDIDTLATVLYVRTDDLLIAAPHLAPWRPKVGVRPRLSDAELVTLPVMQALLGFTSEARFLRHGRAHLRHLFRYLPGQSGCNKRLREASGLVKAVIRLLVVDTTLGTDDVWLADSTPVECGRSRQTAKRSEPAGWAEYGYCASHSRFFRGLRPHLVCTPGGLPVAFALTGAKADERTTPADRRPQLPRPRVRARLGDSRCRAAAPGAQGREPATRRGGRTPAGVAVRVLQRILALTAAIWHND